MANHSPGGIWAGIYAADALALITTLVDVFGFVADLVVPGESSDEIIHSQISCPRVAQ